jgi:DNA-binding NarL/FixJ family response regulator
VLVKWRILIVDDYEVVRIGIRSLLEEQGNITVCAEAKDGLEAIAEWQACNPDIVILDDGLPKVNGMDVAQRILQVQPKQRIVVLGEIRVEPVLRQFLKAGVRSLIWKTDPVSDLLKAVQAVQQDRIYFTKAVSDIVLRGYLSVGVPREPVDDENDLTLREREVTQLVVEGRSSKEVACVLNISTKTAETHRQNAMAKLGVHNVVQLTHYAIGKGIIKHPLQRSAA